MSAKSTEAAFAAVRAAEPAALSRDETERLLGDVRRLRSWLDTVEMATARRLRELSTAGRAEAPESLIAAASGRTGREAKAVADRSDLVDEAPPLGHALAHGDVTAAHLDAVNAAAARLPEEVRRDFLGHGDQLMARARVVGLESFTRECRQLAKHLLAASRTGSDADELDAQRAASQLTRWVDHQTGMHHTHLELDPIRDGQLSAAFNAELARLRGTDTTGGTPWQQLQVTAFVNAVAGIRTPSTRGGETDGDRGVGTPATCRCRRDGGADRGRRVDRVPQATLLISYDWLVGVADGGVCETENGVPLPISTARRLCCDAEIIPALLGTAGEVLDQGRSVRTATEPQRRALRAMHRGCAYPGCGVGFDACRIHHVRWWWRHTGPTDIDNLVPVCEHHHHLVHEGGWTLALAPGRIATWTRPDGHVHHVGPTIDRIPGPTGPTETGPTGPTATRTTTTCGPASRPAPAASPADAEPAREVADALF